MFLFGMLGLAIEAMVLTLTLSGLPLAFVALGETAALRLSIALFANKCTQAVLKNVGADAVCTCSCAQALNAASVAFHWLPLSHSLALQLISRAPILSLSLAHAPSHSLTTPSFGL